MSLFSPRVLALEGYVPGEQPSGQGFIKLNTNENPYACSPTVKAAIGRAVQAGLQKYPDPTAATFRQRGADLLASEVPGMTPDWILCGNGSDDLLTVLVRSFVDPGDRVRFPRPSYVLYDTLTAIQGGASDVVEFQANWTLGDDFTRPDQQLRLALLANPNSPSGTALPPDEVRRIADALPCPLVVDEAYADFAQNNCLGLVSENERVIVTRTMSKSYALAGLRFGFAVAQPHVIRQLAKVKDSYNCDALSIVGATAALEDRDWFTSTRAAILATRAKMGAELRREGFQCVESQANFLWCRHGAQSSEAIYLRLKQQGVLVRYMNYPNWDDGLRITVGTDDQVDALLERLRAVL